ncbi:hypothetical protein UFOVP11_23 [uncultured Caudovirales phage]|uniref:Uncharacterized protein n=1 Tax=uncultured Caudovirales phage TaxID=2100421 RepID=A0A6J5KMH1_9CAUD|nr:hypothetical protein UFOVP11_23 [uncultured Caudovirales phage]
MTTLASAFGKEFEDNKDLVRIRSFEMNGHTFKVKVPLTSEYEAMILKTSEVDKEAVNEYYKKLTEEFISKKDELDPKLGVVFKDNDVEIQGRSMKETARNKVVTENRILAMVKMIVPEVKDFDMQSITYEMVEELFPFSLQLELIERIGEVISPNYSSSKGK